MVEQRSSESDPRQDPAREPNYQPIPNQYKTHLLTRSDSHLQILNPLTPLLKLHRPTIVAQEHDVEKGDLDQVRTELFGDAPLLADLV